MRRRPLLYLSIVLLLLASQLLYFEPKSRVYADSSETSAVIFQPPLTNQSYVIFQDDFEDGEAENWEMRVPPDAPLGSAWR